MDLSVNPPTVRMLEDRIDERRSRFINLSTFNNHFGKRAVMSRKKVLVKFWFPRWCSIKVQVKLLERFCNAGSSPNFDVNVSKLFNGSKNIIFLS